MCLYRADVRLYTWFITLQSPVVLLTSPSPRFSVPFDFLMFQRNKGLASSEVTLAICRVPSRRFCVYLRGTREPTCVGL